MSNDEATGAQDTVMQIIGLAKNVNILQASTLFNPIIFAPPTHGSVSVNADGSFSYTLSANYFGKDSFNNKMTNGLTGDALVESSDVNVLSYA